MATDALSRLDVGERDARAWAVTEASVGVNAWPGYVEGFLDFSPELLRFPLTFGQFYSFSIKMSNVYT